MVNITQIEAGALGALEAAPTAIPALITDVSNLAQGLLHGSNAGEQKVMLTIGNLGQMLADIAKAVATFHVVQAQFSAPPATPPSN